MIKTRVTLKYRITLILTFMIASSLYCQECKFNLDEKDPITGIHQLGHTFLLNSKFILGVGKEGTKPKLTIGLMLPGDNKFTIEPGAKFIIKLENGDTLSHVSHSSWVPTLHSSPSMNGGIRNVTTYHLIFYVDDTFYEKLTEQNTTFIRLIVSEGRTYDAEINKKKANQIQKYSACLR